MSTFLRRRRAVPSLLALAVASVVTLAGCSGTEDSPESSAQDAYTVTHAMGETTVEAAPERVVVLDSPHLDALIALGHTPVGITESSAGTGAPPYLGEVDAELVGLTSEPDIDRIAALAPDLIIGAKVRHEAIYDELSGIAPTVFSENSGTDWQEQARITARPVDEVLGVVPLIVGGGIIALLLLRGLDAIALGDDSAISLGVRPGWVRVWSLVAVALLAGTATALAGPIGFVGLIIPHLARGLVGPSLRRVVPLSMALAPALLLVADVVGRVIGGGAETPAGVVTAFIGAPLLIVYLASGRRVGVT